MAVLNIVLSFALIPSFGIVGAAWAWAVHRFFVMPAFIHGAGKQLFGISMPTLWRESFSRPLMLGSVFLLLSVAFRSFAVSFPALVLVLSALTFAYVGACYFFAIDDTDRAEARKFLQGRKVWLLSRSK